jgi:tetratricopeptide (TPR) repeat protein
MNNSSKYISQQQQETFEKFLMNQMDKTEHDDFIKSLKNDTVLAAHFKEFKSLFRAIEENNLRETLDDFHKETEPEIAKVIKRRPFYQRYAIAASIAVVISIGLWFLNRPVTNEKLFESYYSPDPGLPTVMGSSEEYEFFEAMVYYKTADYSIAITKWEKLLDNKKSNDTLNYFIASAYLANKNIEKAIPYFETVLKNKQKIFYDEATFYLGLAYLKIGDKELAIKYLEKATDERGKVLLGKLKE